MYTLSIPVSVHGKILPQVQVYAEDNHVVLSEVEIDADDNVLLKVVEPFGCKVVIVGYNA